MNWKFTFDPILPQSFLLGFAVLIAVLGAFMIWRKMRASALRLIAGLLILLAMANPSLIEEEREKLKTVVAVIVDESESQSFGERRLQVEKARAALAKRIDSLGGFERREIVVKNNNEQSDENEGSTKLFAALEKAFQDVPDERIGGAIFLTDGRIHDVPDLKALSFDAPLHALITGNENEIDRRIKILNAPRFGIIDTRQTLDFKILDMGSEKSTAKAGHRAEVEIYIDGDLFARESVTVNEENSIDFEVPHGGKIFIELRVAPLEGELTPVNNVAYWEMDGIRENLRVLLVSGEPHSGERAWRNLLKSDASVDLVHFTILRPPEKQDNTPINQLSLIAFPTRELFVEKIDQFDLIIFDRYQRRGVLPILYFDNIARYVEQGGAVLVSAGPEFAGLGSIHNTPLAGVLPIAPNGNIIEKAFRPKISKTGNKHPVTASLEEGALSQDKWGRWFRQIDSAEVSGNILLEGANEKPLLVLERLGEGRIATMMSDHVWLWARGFEGGGPYVQLLRRLSHWLMKEPELEEEALKTKIRGSDLIISRQTMSDDPQTVRVIDPRNGVTSLDLQKQRDGTWEGVFEAKILGLYQLASGDLRSLSYVGTPNPKEFQDVVSSKSILNPLFAETGGYLNRVDAKDSARIPRILPISNPRNIAGKDWMGLRQTKATVLKGVTQLPIFAGFLGLGLLLLAVSSIWYREGR